MRDMIRILPAYMRSALKLEVLAVKKRGERVTPEKIVNETLAVCHADYYESAIAYVKRGMQ